MYVLKKWSTHTSSEPSQLKKADIIVDIVNETCLCLTAPKQNEGGNTCVDGANWELGNTLFGTKWLVFQLPLWHEWSLYSNYQLTMRHLDLLSRKLEQSKKIHQVVGIGFHQEAGRSTIA